MTPSSHRGGNEAREVRIGGTCTPGPLVEWTPVPAPSAAGSALPAASPAARSAPPSLPAEDPRGVSAAAPDGVAVPRGVLLPPPPYPRLAPFLRSAICSGRRDGPQPRVQQDRARTRRRGTVARARTRGPGNALSHKGGGHVGADGPGGCRRELGRPENRPPSLPAGFLGRSRQASPASAGARL